MSIKFLVLGGYLGFFWGGSADFIFMGARIFLKKDFFSEFWVSVAGRGFCNPSSHVHSLEPL